MLHANDLSCAALVGGDRSEDARYTKALPLDLPALRRAVASAEDDESIVLADGRLLVAGVGTADRRDLVAGPLPVSGTILDGYPYFARLRVAVLVDDLPLRQLVVALVLVAPVDALPHLVVDVAAGEAERARKMLKVIFLIFSWLVVAVLLAVSDDYGLVLVGLVGVHVRHLGVWDVIAHHQLLICTHVERVLVEGTPSRLNVHVAGHEQTATLSRHRLLLGLVLADVLRKELARLIVQVQPEPVDDAWRLHPIHVLDLLPLPLLAAFLLIIMASFEYRCEGLPCWILIIHSCKLLSLLSLLSLDSSRKFCSRVSEVDLPVEWTL